MISCSLFEGIFSLRDLRPAVCVKHFSCHSPLCIASILLCLLHDLLLAFLPLGFSFCTTLSEPLASSDDRVPPDIRSLPSSGSSSTFLRLVDGLRKQKQSP